MLNPNYRYILLDLETTGLDTSKDEPIQVGLILIDHELRILDTYTSLIKPKKNIKDLKHIVQYVTWFKLEDLEHAPDIHSIIPILSKYLDNDEDKPLVMIWHNIWFDHAILGRYMDLRHIILLDTYPLSKALMHFQSSYALDVLHQTAIKNRKISEQNIQEHGLKRWYHDALWDCLANLELREAMITHIQQLRTSHMIVDYVLEQWSSQSILKNIISRSQKWYTLENQRLFLPNLKKQQYGGTDKKIIRDTRIDTDLIPDQSSIYIWDSSLQDILDNINRHTKPYVLSFSHKSKSDMATQYFQKSGIHTSTLHDHVVMDPDRIDAFLKKWDFDDSEILFVMKWFDQSDLGHNMLDINTTADYMYFSTLHSKKKTPKGSVMITTHEHLLSMWHNIPNDATVLMFDQDRWYVAMDKFHKEIFDPLHLLNALDQGIYKHHLLQTDDIYTDQLKKFAQACEMLIAVMSIEVNQLFTGTDANQVERSPLEDSTRFPRTKIMYTKVTSLINELSLWARETTSHPTKKMIAEDTHIYHKASILLKYISQWCLIKKRMYHGDKWYYTMADFQTYLGWEDFQASLSPAKYIYMTTNPEKKQYTTDIWDLIPSRSDPLIHIWYQGKMSGLLRQFDKHLGRDPHPIYILSASKNKSQELFKHMMHHKRNQKLDIYAENITWGIWKNVSHAKSSNKHVVIIWWLNMFLAARAWWIKFPLAYIYFCHGKKADQTLRDIKRYG